VSLLQRLLLLPLLSPLLAVLLLGALNPRPWVALRLLTWSSPAWPLGAWISAAAAAGAGLSAAATSLALQGGAQAVSERRQVRRRSSADWPEADGSDPPFQAGPARQQPAAEAPEAPAWSGWGGWAGPTRAAAEPAPTVSVPFRVIRKGRPQGAAAAAPATPPGNAAATATATATSSADDWNTTSSDDW